MEARVAYKALQADFSNTCLENSSVLLMCEGDYIGDKEQFCAQLIRDGCIFFDCIGKHHEEWHLAFDDANVALYPDVREEECFTSISNLILDMDSIEEWLLLSFHPTIEVGQYLVIYESEEQRVRIQGLIEEFNDT